MKANISYRTFITVERFFLDSWHAGSNWDFLLYFCRLQRPKMPGRPPWFEVDSSGSTLGQCKTDSYEFWGPWFKPEQGWVDKAIENGFCTQAEVDQWQAFNPHQ